MKPIAILIALVVVSSYVMSKTSKNVHKTKGPVTVPVAVKCPRSGMIGKSEAGDMLWYCESCKAWHTVSATTLDGASEVDGGPFVETDKALLRDRDGDGPTAAFDCGGVDDGR